MSATLRAAAGDIVLMPNLDEVLANKDTYPDTLTITLADGVETTLGDLRTRSMLERDYRHKTARIANERRAFEQERAEWEAARIEAEAKLTEMAKGLFLQNPTASRDDLDDLLERDPVARKLAEKINTLESKIAERDKILEEAASRMQAYEQAYVADQHRRVLAALKHQDPDLNETELVEFARSNYIPRLDMAYRLMTEDKRTSSAIEKAKKEAHEAAYRKAKEELLQPVIPSRRSTAPAPDAPKTLEEAADAALRDPEILAVMRGDT